VHFYWHLENTLIKFRKSYIKFLNKDEKVSIRRNKDLKLSNIYNKSKSWNCMFWLQWHFEWILSWRHARNNLQAL